MNTNETTLAADISHIRGAVDKEILEKELQKSALLLKKSNRGNFEIYVFSAPKAKNLMNEVGRLRELAFCLEGGGTGKSMDIDQFDTIFDQLISWDPKAKEIVGGYRIQHMNTLINLALELSSISPVATYFTFNQDFFDNYLPYTAELGRSFVNPLYQNSPFALESLFDGIGAWISQKNKGIASLLSPEQEDDGFFSLFWNLFSLGKDKSMSIPPIKKPVSYLLGKITFYPVKDTGRLSELTVHSSKNSDLDPLYMFIDHYFVNTNHKLIEPKGKYEKFRPYKRPVPGFSLSGSMDQDLKLIKKYFVVPPLFIYYVKLSNNMQCFGTIKNEDFGNTEETAMLIPVDSIHESHRKRYGIT